MESLISPASTQSSLISGTTSYTKYDSDLLVLQQTLDLSSSSDTSSASIDDLYKGLSISAQNIVDKLNELLKAKLPDGIQSLKPEEVTPEATAERIVSGVTGFFEVFAKQNPDLDPEELLAKFMSEVRKGVESGYNDAAKTLEDLGAFEFDGVKDGIEKTKSLIEEKLKAFESHKRQDLGLDPKVDAESVAEVTKQQVLQQAGSVSLSLVA
ncbi:MAG: DUF5610 domain-containing protein [Deltaproteobacteria bacterium]|nr:DUF5610 domain-containing protein [Deltaproteobacteria bacterium]